MSLRHRPPDPPFAGTSIREARRRLQEHDKRLDLWWNESRHCWEVREFTKQTESWSYCFLWRGPNGEYRNPADGFGALLDKLAETDTTRWGDTPNAYRHWDNWMGQKRVELMAKKRAEIEHVQRTLLPDYIRREGGRSGGMRKPGDHRRDTSDEIREAAAEIKGMA